MAKNTTNPMEWLTDKMTGDRFLNEIGRGDIEAAISTLDHQGYHYGDDPSIDSVFNSKIAVIQQWMKRSLDLSITDGIYAWRMIKDFDLPWDSIASWWTDNPDTKAQVVRSLLKLMHEGHYSDVLEIIDSELAYLDLGWKELAVIRKSAEHELDRNVLPDLLESDYDDDRRRDMQYDDDSDAVNIDDEFVDLFGSYKRVDDIDTVLDIAAEKLGNNDRELDRLVRDNADQIVHWFEDNADRSSAKSILFFLTVFSEFCDVARWSTEFRDAIDHRREEFVKYLLPRFVTDNVPKSEVAVLSSIVDWPELDAMQRSISANQTAIKETIKLSDLDTASEKQQLSTVKKDWRRIKYITNPSEAVQLAAVQGNGIAIYHILEHKIVPSEAVQLAAVQQDGYVINYLISNSIVPSKAVQIAAIQQDGTMITKINRPTPGLFADANVKHSVIKTLLTDIQKTYYFKAEQLVKFLRRHNVEWPELDAIERSLNAIPLSNRTPQQQQAAQDIDEASNLTTRKVQNALVDGIDQLKTQGLYKLPNLTPMLTRAGATPYEATELISSRKADILFLIKKAMKDSHSRQIGQDTPNGARSIAYLKTHGFDWPQLSDIVAENQDNMLASLTRYINLGNYIHVKELLDTYVSIGLPKQLAKKTVKDLLMGILKQGLYASLLSVRTKSVIELLDQLGVKISLGTGIVKDRWLDGLRKAVEYHGLDQSARDMLFLLTKYGDPSVKTEIAAVFNENKDTIVREMLTMIKRDPKSLPRVVENIKTLRHYNIDWPELNAIERSANAFNKSHTVQGITENDEDDDEGPVVRMSSPDEQIVDRMYRRMREGSYMALYDAIADLEERRMPDHMIEEVLRPQADSIIRWLDRNIKSGMYQWKNVDQIWKLLEMGARWPALVRLLNDHKEIMMYHLLNDVKAGTSASIDLEDVLGHLDQLAEIGVDWKELEIIKRSVNKELDRIHGIDESLRVNQQAAVNTWYDRFIENIKNNYHAELSWNLIMMGRLTAAVSVPMQTPVVNKHKHAIVKAMLEAISNLNPDAANNFNYSDREQKEMLVGARKLDVAWPELDIMERSVNANAAPKGSIA